MFRETGNSFGVNEVLLASVLAAVVFSLFSCQPLCIVGVTGPITVFNYTIYDIVTPLNIPYFQFMAWISLWAMVFHFILAITNSSNALRYVTRMSCDVFGLFVQVVYCQKGVQILIAQFEAGDASAFLSIAIALMVFVVGFIIKAAGHSKLFKHLVRLVLVDYSTVATVIFFTGFSHIGRMANTDLLTLPVTQAFRTTSGRGWLVDFWTLPPTDIFTALPFGILLTILFYFDHNVSSLMAQGTEFPLKKPPGFHWDLFLLGITTGIAGILGLPAPNGLIPQAPLHTASLCVRQLKEVRSDVTGKNKVLASVDRIVEQRFTNLGQGLLILITMSPPLLHVLGLIPEAVLAGLFWVMAIDGIQENGIVKKTLWLMKDKRQIDSGDPFLKCRLKLFYIFVSLQYLTFAIAFAMTQTVAAVGFPVIIMMLIPMRVYYLPKIFSAEELSILDAPTASPFTMKSVGGMDASVSDGVPIPETSESGYENDQTPNDNEASALEKGPVNSRRP